LKMEFRILVQYIIRSDFKEGVRAFLIEKDFKPNWNPRSISEVTDEHVARYFQPSPDGDELYFEKA